MRVHTENLRSSVVGWKMDIGRKSVALLTDAIHWTNSTSIIIKSIYYLDQLTASYLTMVRSHILCFLYFMKA